MKTTYLSTAETAKLIRAALKRAFPRTKFSVRSHRYSGGASIDVGWADGPAAAAVDPIVQQFRRGDFDGMIDMKVHFTSWLLPDGTATIASHPGTDGSTGVISAVREWMPHPEAKLVSFGADFVFTKRDMSADLLRRAVARLAAKGYPVEAVEVQEGSFGASIRTVTYDAAVTRGFDMEREVYRAACRTHCVGA